MTDETVSLKEYFDRVLSEKDKAVSIALAAAKEAVDVAERNAEKWRDNANEWRGAMMDRENKFMSQAEFAAFKESVEKDVRALNTFKDTQSGKASQTDVTRNSIIAYISLAIGAISLLIGILFRVLEK